MMCSLASAAGTPSPHLKRALAAQREAFGGRLPSYGAALGECHLARQCQQPGPSGLATTGNGPGHPVANGIRSWAQAARPTTRQFHPALIQQ